MAINKVVEYYGSNYYIDGANPSTFPFGFSFKAPKNMTLSSVAMCVTQFISASTDFDLKLYSTQPGSIVPHEPNELITSQNITYADFTLTGQYNWNLFEFDSKAPLTEGEYYSIVVDGAMPPVAFQGVWSSYDNTNPNYFGISYTSNKWFQKVDKGCMLFEIFELGEKTFEETGFIQTTDFIYPSNVVSSTNYTNPNNILTENDTPAYYELDASSEIVVDGFNFNIPEGYEIVGVSIVVKAYTDNALGLSDIDIYVGDKVIGNTGAFSPNTYYNNSIGDQSNNLSITTLDGFNLKLISNLIGYSGEYTYIDSVKVKIYYKYNQVKTPVYITS